ncbi:MAG: segregation and condensation protein A [Actinomycetota bacterium]
MAVVHQVKLDVFEGPIDLLLHLITRQRVDIYDVSLATITEEYLAAIGSLDDVDLESATGFLVVAATLLELKSARLLPSRSLDPEEVRLLEERDLLLARLVECATYREAGVWILGRLRSGEGLHGRSVVLEPQFQDLVPDLLGRTRREDLARAAADVLAQPPRAELDTSHVAPIQVSVRAAILRLAGDLSGGGERSFAELCRDAGERIEVVVRFLALLELFKGGAIEVGQVDRFGEIRARWTGEVTVESVVEEAEEYALEVGP